MTVPTMCFSILEETFDPETQTGEIICIKAGDAGYYKTTHGKQSRQWLRDANDMIGVNDILQQAFEICSMFGNWSKLSNIVEHIGAAMKRASTANTIPVHINRSR